MATLMIEYHLPTDAVSNYEEWKVVFDTDPVGRKARMEQRVTGSTNT